MKERGFPGSSTLGNGEKISSNYLFSCGISYRMGVERGTAPFSTAVLERLSSCLIDSGERFLENDRT